MHRGEVPDTVPALGNGNTVIAKVSRAAPQLVVLVNVMMAEPTLLPLTNPPDTEAMDALLLLHTPVVLLSVSVVVVPKHRLRAPVIRPTTGNGEIVMVQSAVSEPHELV